MDRMTKHLVKLHGGDMREKEDGAFVTEKATDPLLFEPKPREVYHETIKDQKTGQKQLR